MNKKCYCIVPAYNCEHIVPSFFEIIKNQTIFNDLFFIIINDGSKDETLNKLEKFSSGHNNIKVISKTNGGAGSARNAGLDYLFQNNIDLDSCLMFLDIDDFIPNTYFENMLSIYDKTNADCLLCGIKKVYNDHNVSLIPCNTNQTQSISKCAVIKEFLKENIFPCSMGKVFKMSSWENCRFDEECVLGEDTPAIFYAICANSNIYISNYCEYSLDRKTGVSITRSDITNRKLLSIPRSYMLVNETIKECNDVYIKDFLKINANVFGDNYLSVIRHLSTPLTDLENKMLNESKNYYHSDIQKYFKPKSFKLKIKKILYRIQGFEKYSKLGK